MSDFIDHINKNETRYELVSKPLLDIIATSYTVGNSYSVGEYVIYDNKLYVCINDVSENTIWDVDKWQETKLTDYANIHVDDTLKVSGKAADSYSVGNAIISLQENFDNRFDESDSWKEQGITGQILSKGEDGLVWKDEIIVDESLSIEGQAADAKAVGDKINRIINNPALFNGEETRYRTMVIDNAIKSGNPGQIFTKTARNTSYNYKIHSTDCISELMVMTKDPYEFVYQIPNISEYNLMFIEFEKFAADSGWVDELLSALSIQFFDENDELIAETNKNNIKPFYGYHAVTVDDNGVNIDPIDSCLVAMFANSASSDEDEFISIFGTHNSLNAVNLNQVSEVNERYPIIVPKYTSKIVLIKSNTQTTSYVRGHIWIIEPIIDYAWVDNPPVDATLTQRNRPADAKAVGNAISDINNTIENTVITQINESNAWQKQGTVNQILSKTENGIGWVDNPPTDTTLSHSGSPADAKEVGDKFASHDARINLAAGDATEALNDAATLKVQVKDHSESMDDIETRVGTMETNYEMVPNNAIPYPDEGVVRFYHDDIELFSIPMGGGGGGSSSATVIMTSKITSGWVTKNSTLKDIPVTFEWSSTEDGLVTGPGSVTVSTNGYSRTTPVEQGSATAIIEKAWLHVDKNNITILIQDSMGNVRRHPLTVFGQELSISSTLDPKDPFYGNITVGYTPIGKMPKVIHFVLDGKELSTVETDSSGTAMEYVIPQQAAGTHSLEIYAVGTIGGEEITSDHLYYELMWLDEFSSRPLITITHKGGDIGQFYPVNIPWRVYTPNVATTNVTISVNGVVVQELQDVDRSEQTFNYVFENYNNPDDENDVTVVSFFAEGMTEAKSITFKVAISEVQVEAETAGLELYLDSKSRSNSASDWNVWEYNGIRANFVNFLRYYDGWQTDDEGQVVLRVKGDARVNIPYMPFSNSFLGTGRTISIEFTSRDVFNYEAPIITCMSDGKGFSITPNMMIFNTGTEVWQRYNENTHIRADFVFDADTVRPFSDAEPERLIKLFINGVWSRTLRYKPSEVTNQTSPVGISIGATGATVDIYCIRVYNRSLTDRQIEKNWIADTRDPVLRTERYYACNIFDSHGDITPESLNDDTTYTIMTIPDIPPDKDTKKYGTIEHINPQKPTLNVMMNNVEMAAQGTSSMAYPTKNISAKAKEKNSIFVAGSSTGVSEYALSDNSIPYKSWVFKVDMASSEGTNNVMGVELYNRFCPYKTREMKQDSRIRWGIEGYPTILFYRNSETNVTEFYSKANFNLPKRAPGPYGYPDDDDQLENPDIPSRLESWEIQTNNTRGVKFQGAEAFTSEEWKKDFESRIPDDYFIKDKIQYLVERISATYREDATGNQLSSPVTYIIDNRAPLTVYSQTEGKFTFTENNGKYTVICTHDTAAKRLIQFRAEFPEYAQLDAWCFYYILTYYLLGTDSYAKNLFIGFRGDDVQDAEIMRYFKRKAVPEPYDMDTILGINNSGFLTYSPFLTDTDRVESNISGGEADADGKTNVWQAQDATIMNNIRDAFPDVCRQVLVNAFAAGLTADFIINLFRNHRKIWSPAIYNYDQFKKYVTPALKPLTYNSTTGKMEPDESYLNMLQGSKDSQMEWFVRNRTSFVHSQYAMGEANNNFIRMRIYNEAAFDIHYIKPIFGAMRFGEGGENIIKRVPQDLSPVRFEYKPGTTVNNFEIRILSSHLISEIEGIADTLPNEVNLSYASSLVKLILGGDTVNNNLNTLTVKNLPFLQQIEVRNCPNLKTDIDLENSTDLRIAKFDGSGITEVRIGEGCAIETLVLPSSITHLVLRYLPKLSNFTISSWDNIEVFMLAGVDASIIDPIESVSNIKAGAFINIEGFEVSMDSVQDIIDFYEILNTMHGVTRQREGNTWKPNFEEEDPETGQMRFLSAQVSGIIHLDSISGDELATLDSYNYTNIRIDALHTTSYRYFKTYDGKSLIERVSCSDGVQETSAPSIPTRTSTAEYDYTPIGWSTYMDSDNANVDLNEITMTNVTYYAAYSRKKRQYTITFRNKGTVIQQSKWDYGAIPIYSGATPTSGDQTSTGWNKPIVAVTGDTTYDAAYKPLYTATFVTSSVYGGRQLYVGQFEEGSTPVYRGEELSGNDQYDFMGFSPEITPIYKNTTYTAIFVDKRSIVIQYIAGTISQYNSTSTNKIGEYAFNNRTALTSVTTSSNTIEQYAFAGCTSLNTVDLKSTFSVTIDANAFNGCTNLNTLFIRSTTMATLSNTNAFTGTKIASKEGSIYVPSGMASIYLANSLWANYDIKEY